MLSRTSAFILATVLLLICYFAPNATCSTTQYVYDELDRLSEAHYDAVNWVEYKYDEIGNLVQKIPHGNVKSITPVAGVGGTVIPAGNTTFFVGSSGAFTIQPSTGYTISDVIVDGVSKGPQSGNYRIAFSNINSTLEARFQPVSFLVNYIAGPNGTLSGPTSQTVLFNNSTFPVTAVPNAGYTFASWSGPNGFTSLNNPLSIQNVSSSQTITANFTAAPAPPSAPTGISAQPGNGQGTISWTAGTGSTSSLVRYGTTSGQYPTTVDPAASPLTLTGLSNGVTVYFQVGAKSNVSTTWSSEFSLLPTAGTNQTPISQTWSTAGNYTFTIPAGVTALSIDALGGGGHGGSGAYGADTGIFDGANGGTAQISYQSLVKATAQGGFGGKSTTTDHGAAGGAGGVASGSLANQTLTNGFAGAAGGDDTGGEGTGFGGAGGGPNGYPGSDGDGVGSADFYNGGGGGGGGGARVQGMLAVTPGSQVSISIGLGSSVTLAYNVTPSGTGDIGSIIKNTPGTYTHTFTANATVTLTYLKGAGGEGGDYYGFQDGASGEASTIVYDGILKATAYGGGGGHGNEDSLNGAPGSATNTITGATNVVGGGNSGGLGAQDGGNGGNGGAVTGGTFQAAAGKTITITLGSGGADGIGGGAPGVNASVSISWQ